MIKDAFSLTISPTAYAHVIFSAHQEKEKTPLGTNKRKLLGLNMEFLEELDVLRRVRDAVQKKGERKKIIQVP